MGPRARTAAAWAFVVAVAFAGQYVLPWAAVPLIALTSAHSDPVMATLVVLVQLALWVVLLGAAIWIAVRFIMT